jgi:hypothetical protein
MSSNARFLAGLIGLPILMPFVILVYFTPRYIPSEALARAAEEAVTPLAGRYDLEDLLRECRQGVDLDSGDLAERPRRLYSWENDAGLIGVTRLDCTEGYCRVSASALLPPMPMMKLSSCSGGRRLPFHPPA